MNRTKSFYRLGVIIFLSTILLSCERDDICAESTPTTPLLIIRFYDFDNPSEFKIPPNLGIAESDQESGLLFNSDSIAIPLRTDIDQTSFRFVLNATGEADMEDISNEDLVNITYERTEDYVSKACGFRITYDTLDTSRTPQPDGFWIQDLIIDNTTVDNETTAHIRIFH